MGEIRLDFYRSVVLTGGATKSVSRRERCMSVQTRHFHIVLGESCGSFAVGYLSRP